MMTFHNETRMLISADGTEIYANAVGDPSKQAIVFIHGFAWSFMAFDDIFDDPQWTSQLYLVRYDHRGHGRSGKPVGEGAWESKRLAEDFDAVVEGFKVKKPFVVGWSMGSLHLIDILSFHPTDDLAGIINIAGATHIPETTLSTLATPLTDRCVYQLVGAPTIEEFQEGAIDFINGCCPTLTYEVKQQCLGNIMMSSRKALMCAASRKHNHEVFYEAGKTELACLYIYGDKDELIFAREVLGYYKGWRNFRSEEVQGGSHLPWSKTNEKAAVMFNEKVLGWIDGIMGVGKKVDGKM